LLNLLGQLIWLDYVVILFIFIGAIIGLKRGFALGLINLTWLSLALIFAGSFYASLSEAHFFWLFNQQPFNSFLSLLALFLIIKTILYKLLSIIATIHGPCPLNRFLAFLIGVTISLSFSWILAKEVVYIDFIHQLIVHKEARLFTSFALIFALLTTVAFILIKLLNIKVGIDRPCPLLLALRPLDSILNAKKINHPINHFFGFFLGAFKAVVLVVILMIIFNQFDYTINIQILNYLDNSVQHIQNVLADYFTFIHKTN
jgi:uncharacterized membrane protein required for colicin V production